MSNVTLQHLQDYVEAHDEAFIFTHCEANALRIWRKFGGEIFQGTADRYDVVDGQINQRPVAIDENHYWNVLTIDGHAQTTFDAYNHTDEKIAHYTTHRGEKHGAAQLIRNVLELAKSNQQAFNRISPLVEDRVISNEVYPAFCVDQFYRDKPDGPSIINHLKRPIAIAHITSPAQAASIITSGRFYPAYTSPHAADAGLNCFVVEHGFLSQTFGATGAEIQCVWHGPIAVDTNDIKLPYRLDTLWFDPTWRGFIPIHSTPELLQVTGYKFYDDEAVLDWYLSEHSGLFRFLMRFSKIHYNYWIKQQYRRLDSQIREGVFIKITSTGSGFDEPIPRV